MSLNPVTPQLVCLAALALAVGAAVAGCGGGPGSDRAAASVPSSGSATTSTSGAAKRVVIIGSDETAGSPCAAGAGTWAEGVRSVSAAASTDILARPGAGFTVRSGAGKDFRSMASSTVRPDTTVVVFAPGATDLAEVVRMDDSAEAAFAAVHAVAPRAQILVVGPLWTGGATGAEQVPLAANSLRSAAQRTGTRVLDTTDLTAVPGASCSGGGGLTATGARSLAAKVTDAVSLLGGN